MELEYHPKPTRAVTHAELLRFVKAADEEGEMSIGTAAMIAYYWLQREEDILKRLENAITRGLLAAEDRAEPWPVIQGCYAAQLSDAALDWLAKGGVITDEQRGDAAAIIRGISTWLEHSTA